MTMDRNNPPSRKNQVIGVVFPPEIAAAIRRQGNRHGSISAIARSLICDRKLQKLIDRDAALQQPLDPVDQN